MQIHSKVVGGIFNPNEKGIEFPPKQSLQMASKVINKGWIEISVSKTVRNKETER